MRGKISALLVSVSAMALAQVARADVEISKKPTSNMSCDSGVCTATARKAVLNVANLATMLAAGDVMVSTGSLAKDIDIDQPLTWSSAARLTLDAQDSITVNKPVTVAGQGALTITYDNQSGDNDLYFFDKGCVTFWDTSSSLIIDGQSYILAADLPSLAALMNNNGGSFALANDYDAKKDKFAHSPVYDFDGNFEGLGHTISHFKLRGGSYQTAGLIAKASGGTIRDIYLKQVNVRNRNKTYVGGLVGLNQAMIINASVDGMVSGIYQFAEVGGLVGENQGAIERSRSAASASATGRNSLPGGLVGLNWGLIQQSYATGTVNSATSSGDLVGGSFTGISDSYATGPVFAAATAGGFAGGVDGYVDTSYSTGPVSGSCIGGFVGGDGSGNKLTNSYWDMDTSGISDPSQGACSPPNAPGITGLSDAQLKSGLPAGFDKKSWGSDPKINNGYPYLLKNPPR